MPTDYNKIAEEHARDYGARRKHLGIYRSLYARKTHFIYELIQNANDAHASKLMFLLRSDELIICNDGRPFTEKDVRSICSIGSSTKDLTQAGTFGIGFKAVYTYTSCPEIYSGGEHFRIREFVIPEGINTVPPQVRNVIEEGRAVLRLPFNNKVRPQDIEQLQNELRNLHPLTFLFLRNLKSIRWVDESTGESGEYNRTPNPHSSIPNAQAVILKQAIGDATQIETQFIVFSRAVKPPQRVTDELVRQVEADDETEAEEERKRIRHSAKEKQLVEIAFSLVDESISPVDGCVFFSYLPTEKETHLRFLFQARYQTTPARDNVPDGTDSAWNGWLVEETAAFLPVVLKQLKDAGYINPSFFDVLPINSDGVPQILEPIIDSLTRTIRENKYIPLENGQYGQPDQAFYPHSQDLRKLLDSSDLASLTKTSDASWLNPEIREIKEHERRFEFLQSLGVKRVDASRFTAWLCEQMEKWLRDKNDEWMADLYLYLSRQKAEWESLKKQPLVRLENGGHVSAKGQPVFFPPKDDKGGEELMLLSNEVPLVRGTVLDGRREIEGFLVEMGVKPLNPVEIIREWLLPHYEGRAEALHSTARQHLRYLIIAVDKVPATDKRKLVEDLREKRILLAKKSGGGEKLSLIAPKHLYLPSAYTGSHDLEAYFTASSPGVYFLDEGYLESKEEQELWRSFMRELGCAEKPRLLHKSLSANRKQQIRGASLRGPEKEEGNTILEGLESFLSNPLDHDRVMLLWRILERVDIKSFQGKYYWDNNFRPRISWHHEEPFDTDTLILLKGTPWLLDDENTPRKPAELFASTLENRRLLGSTVYYLHPDIDLADRPDKAKSRSLAASLGLHLRADTVSVLNYIRSLSNSTDIDPKVVRTLYRFLDDNHVKPIEDFSRDKLLLTMTPRHCWWKSHEVFWEDESAVFGEDRGYLEHHYPEGLKLFFLSIGVAPNAQPLDYLKAIQKLSLQQEVTSDTYIRIRNIYRRLWVAIQEDKKLRDNGDQKLVGSAEWSEALTSQYWLGRRDGQHNFYRLEQLVWNDHSYISRLFAESLPFWGLEDLREFREYLKVQPCSQASVGFHPQGAREHSISWSERVRSQLHWLRSFLNSPRWKGQLNNISFEELDRLQVWLVDEAKISYTLKGVSIYDPEPCLTYFDNDGVLWVTSEAMEEEYPDQIGDALQSYFRVNELREFAKDLLTRRLEDVLRIWQKRGLEVSLASSDSEQTPPGLANADEESEGSASEQNAEPRPSSIPASTQGETSPGNSPAGTSSNQGTGTSNAWRWPSNFGGGGGEGEAHRALKEQVAANPNLISLGLKLVRVEYEFPSLDCVDILFETEQRRPVPVEIKTYITPGDYKGVWQSVKYKHLAAALYKIECEDVRTILVAHEIPDDVKAKCLEMGIDALEVAPTTK